MLLSHTFICDLRVSDKDAVLPGILASSIAEAMWEYAIFLATSSTNQIQIQWNHFVINTDGCIYHLMPGSDFSLDLLKDSLNHFRNLEFSDPIPSEQDPLSTTIGLASFGSGHPLFIFLSSYADYIDELQDSLVRWSEVSHCDHQPVIAVVGDQTELAERYAEITATVQISNPANGLFKFFRSIAVDYFFPPLLDLLEIGNHSIQCTRIQLIAPQKTVETVQKCRCHHYPPKKPNTFVCAVSGQRTSVVEESAIGGFSITLQSEGGTNRLSVLYRIPTTAVNEAALFGTSQILQSSSPKFARLLNEMRASGSALIAQRLPSAVIGGEFFALLADGLRSVIHMRGIANRAQIVWMDPGEGEEADGVAEEPILSAAPERESVDLMELGAESEILTL